MKDDKKKDKKKEKEKEEDKDNGILGWGMAEKTRKTIKKRTSDIDKIVNDATTGKPKKRKKKD